MKRGIIVFFSIMVFFAGSCKAERLALTVDSYGIPQQSFSGGVEVRLGAKTSIAAQGVTMRFEEEDLAGQAKGGALGLRRYVFGQALTGAYWGLYGSVVRITKAEPNFEQVWTFGPALTVGLKTVVAKHVAVDLSLSSGIAVILPADAEDPFISFGLPGFGLNLGLGLAW